RYIIDDAYSVFKETIKNNKTEISDLFFVNYQIRKTCTQCEVISYYYEQRPIINLYIQQQVNKSIVLEGKLKDISLKNNFNFLLNDYIDVEEDCEICRDKFQCKINNSIKDSNSHVLVINLNRGK
ncbi:MAG: hypothetical protein ILN61_01600, partial [Lachnospiraceae bacterium]|nr:hypothetical protein [Lachnospiraceae bacterium]